jgi:hypothetical protein
MSQSCLSFPQVKRDGLINNKTVDKKNKTRKSAERFEWKELEKMDEK